MEALTIQSKEKISYTEAKRRVQDRLIKPHRTFAAAARSLVVNEVVENSQPSEASTSSAAVQQPIPTIITPSITELIAEPLPLPPLPLPPLPPPPTEKKEPHPPPSRKRTLSGPSLPPARKPYSTFPIKQHETSHKTKSYKKQNQSNTTSQL